MVVGGTQRNEGAIIVRDPNPNSTLVYHLGEFQSGWYVAQTNYEPDEADNPVDARRDAVIGALENLGQDEAATKLGLFACVSTHPVYNENTAYTAIMEASTGELHAFVRSTY